MRNMIRGIAVANPVDIEKEYLLQTVEYAVKNNMTHMQFIGPIHNPQKGNIDGMTLYRKYERFNAGKDAAFIEKTMDAVHAACEITSAHGIKTYVWHHELELPTGFEEAYPEILNTFGDVEVTHPIVRDFIEHKIRDFFAAYPKVDGFVLTLHETRIPLLKLKNQKLDKIGRVKYVTEILHNTCAALGKEMIVRPFASIEEDYAMMMEAYESISKDMVVMDKWTQFDWSLCLPHNKFYNKIKNNPLLVETDIFGEFFGKGRLPLMLKEHIKEKFAYCEGHDVIGYCSRIDRAGCDPFGEANEVNLTIMNACMNGADVDAEILRFFENMYPGFGEEVLALMEPTEEILKKTIYLKGYYYSELSAFPSINHSKNHFYFEMMRDAFSIASNEWFIPIGWERGSIEGVLQEKADAAAEAAALYEKVCALEGKIEEKAYKNLWTKFLNLKYTTAAWEQLALSFYHYARYFEFGDRAHRDEMEKCFEKLAAIHAEGVLKLGEDFYCTKLDIHDATNSAVPLIPNFIRDMRASLAAEEMENARLSEKGYLDYVVCGGGMEGHKLQKEVNFSDTYIKGDKLCRIPGTRLGAAWSTVNAHGWFSYAVKVSPMAENKVIVEAGSMTDTLNVEILIGEEKHVFSEKTEGIKTLGIPFTETAGKETVRIRFDRNSKDTPLIYTVAVK